MCKYIIKITILLLSIILVIQVLIDNNILTNFLGIRGDTKKNDKIVDKLTELVVNQVHNYKLSPNNITDSNSLDKGIKTAIYALVLTPTVTGVMILTVILLFCSIFNVCI